MITGAIALSIHSLSLQNNLVDDLVGEKVIVYGVVSSDPNKTAPRVIGSRETNSRITFLLRAESIEVSSRNSKFQGLRLPLRILSSETLTFIPGEEVRISGALLESKERKVAGLFFATPGGAESISRPLIQDSLEGLRAKLRDGAAQIGGDSASLLPGMVIGDTSLQRPEFSKLMISAGLSHLTAVSGANFAIISAFLFALLGLFIPNRKVQLLITIIALCFYVLLARPTPSVVRAATMVTIYLFAKFSGRRTLAASTLAVAVTAILLINPFLAFEPGFILSVLATTGLIFLAPSLADRIPGPKIVSELIAIPTSATIFCAPYILLLSGSLNLGTIVLNILAAPAIPFITILTFIAMLIIIPASWLAIPILKIADLGADWIVVLAQVSDEFPSFVTSPITILLIFIGITVMRKFGWKGAMPIFATVLLLSMSQRIFFPGGDWRIGQCDVGQGDALLVNLGDGSAILFDAGPDIAKLNSCLSLFGVKRLPLVVISHSHADHYVGLKGLQGVAIGEIWSNRSDLAFASSKTLEVRAGFEADIGEVGLSIIWPKTGTESFESISGDGSPENNRSVVSLVEIDGRKLLVTGDIEPGAQSELIDALPDLDFIKVPHHGSRFQNLDLFTSAEVFLVSVGINTYGHPDGGLISHLEQLGRVFRTDLDGAIAIGWESGGPDRRFSLKNLGKEWWRIAWH